MTAAITEFSEVALNGIAVYLFALVLIGFFLNGLFLVVYARDKTLRSPINVLFVNLAISDLVVGLFGTLTSFVVTLVRTLMVSDVLCQMYGFVTFLGGMASLFSLMCISLERYMVVVRPFSVGNLSYKGAAGFVGFIWVAALVFAVAPLAGLSRYTPEGAGMWCSIDWEDGNRSTTIYIILIFTLGFLLPVLVIAFSYGMIIYKVRQAAKTQAGAAAGAGGAEKSLLRQTISMFAAYFLAWTPYAIVCLMAATGATVSPRTAAVPALLAKSSFVSNPVIYVLLNRQFKNGILRMLWCGQDMARRMKREGESQTSGTAMSEIHNESATKAASALHSQPPKLNVPTTRKRDPLPKAIDKEVPTVSKTVASGLRHNKVAPVVGCSLNPGESERLEPVVEGTRPGVEHGQAAPMEDDLSLASVNSGDEV